MRFERESSGEQLEQQHSERVDVGLHPDPATLHLLGRGVGRGHQAEAGARGIRPRSGGVELLGDAEVEQLHRPVRLHEDVGRLEISVDDGVAVSVLNRLAHRPEQPEPLGQGAAARPAVLGERDALHVLHREPRGAVRQRARVVELRDGRMVQLGQRPLLGEKPRPARGRDPAIAEQLQRRAAADVFSLDEVDDAHPALAEQAQHAIRAHSPRRVGTEQVVGDLRQRAVQERARGPVLDEQRLHLGDQRRVSVGARLEESVLLGRGQVRRRVEEVLDPAPAFRAGGRFSVSAGAHGPGRLEPRASRAARWPRRCRGSRRSRARRAHRRSGSRR